MTLPPLVTPGDISTRMQRPTPFAGPELNRVTAVCADASDLVRFESRNDWIDPDDPTLIDAPAIVILIARRCAERAVRNPEGFSAEHAGDYSYERPGAIGEGGLYLTAREVADLRRAGGGTGGLWVQPIARTDYEDLVSLGQAELITGP